MVKQILTRLFKRWGQPSAPPISNPSDIALSEERHDPSGDNSARVLLWKQAQLVDHDIAYRYLQVRNERVSLTLRRLTTAVGTVAGATVALMAWSAWRASGAVVESFEAPPALAQRGLSGNVVAASFQDALATIQGNVRTTARRRAIDNAWTGDISVQVPQTGVSIGEVDRLLRRKLGSETYISGSLVQNVDGSATLMIRGSGIDPRSFSGPVDQLPQLITTAAEYVYGAYEPRLFATYLYQKKRYAEGETFVTSAFARADDAVRPELLVYWGLMLSQQQRRPEAINKLRLGVTQDPTLWRGWNSLVGNTRAVYGEEASWRVGQELIRAAAAAPANNKPSALGWYNFQSLSQDWTGQIEKLEDDARMTGGGGSFGVLSATLLADAELRRHDWAGARHYIDMADPNDPALPAMRLFAQGYQELDSGRPDLALAPLEAFLEIWKGSPEIKFQYEYGPCFVALAQGLGGHANRVNATIALSPQTSVCEVMRADIIASGTSPAQADLAYARAIRLAPSLPFAWQRWGEALLRRGDLDRAYAMFTRAARQAPRWADPLKGQGDILSRWGKGPEALARYDAALGFAPRWAALRDARRAGVSDTARNISPSTTQ